jgi:hypothetical protein
MAPRERETLRPRQRKAKPVWWAIGAKCRNGGALALLERPGAGSSTASRAAAETSIDGQVLKGERGCRQGPAGSRGAPTGG